MGPCAASFNQPTTSYCSAFLKNARQPALGRPPQAFQAYLEPLRHVTLQVVRGDPYSGLVSVLDLGLDNQVPSGALPEATGMAYR